MLLTSTSLLYRQINNYCNLTEPYSLFACFLLLKYTPTFWIKLIKLKKLVIILHSQILGIWGLTYAKYIKAIDVLFWYISCFNLQFTIFLSIYFETIGGKDQVWTFKKQELHLE